MYAVSFSNKDISWSHSAWDPTEPVATRPLFTQRGTGYKFFYTCDGNKNVSELVHFETRNGIAAHYDYAPFGAVTRSVSASTITDNTFTTDNPFRFSSEYHDDTLGLVYYNYRHYNPIDGRWISRDPMENLHNYRYPLNVLSSFDLLGLTKIEITSDRVWRYNKHGVLQQFYRVAVHILEHPSKCCNINFIQIKKSLYDVDYMIDNVKNSKEPYYYLQFGVGETIHKQKNGNVVEFYDGPGGAIDATDFILYVVEVCREFIPSNSIFSFEESSRKPIKDNVKVLATARLSVGDGGRHLGENYTESNDSNDELINVLERQKWFSRFWARETEINVVQ